MFHDARTSRHLPFAALLVLCLFAASTAAQEAGEAEGGGEDPSRETDVTEDNYRRFMELDDRQRERPAFPTAAFPSNPGLKKLDELPEDSKKHLRNQLRGIILQRGPWTPDQREADFPFVPSAAARKDGNLLRKEAEAWAELVNEYHEREALNLAGNPGDPGSQAQAPGPSGDGTAGTDGHSSPSSAQSQGESQEPSREQGQGPAQARNGDSAAERGGEPGQTQAQARSQAVQAPEFQETPEAPAETAPSDEGTAQSAADYLQEKGLAAGQVPPVDPGSAAGASRADPGRWGEEATTVLPPPEREVRESETSVTIPDKGLRFDATGEEPGTARSGLLTVEELRRVRGVEENPFPGDPDAGAFNGFIAADGDEAAEEDAEVEPPVAPEDEDRDD